MLTPANADGRPVAAGGFAGRKQGASAPAPTARRHTSPAPSADFMGTPTAHTASCPHARVGFTKKKNLRLAATRPEARRAPPFFGGGSPSRCRVRTSRGDRGSRGPCGPSTSMPLRCRQLRATNSSCDATNLKGSKSACRFEATALRSSNARPPMHYHRRPMNYLGGQKQYAD